LSADRNPASGPWPEGSAEEHGHDLDQILSGEWSKNYPYVVFAAEADGGKSLDSPTSRCGRARTVAIR
jgi:hypothetical protein